jgi:hypothetical protein
MSTENADSYASYLLPEIEQARKLQQDTQKGIQYKQAGLDFVSACKYNATNDNNEIDIDKLKLTLTQAIAFVQAYHDAL